MDSLPKGWIATPIKNLCLLINGKAFKPSDWSKVGLPIVRIQNLNKPNAPYNYFDGRIEDRFLINNGELLFAWSGTPGTSFGAHIWKGQKAVLNQHIFKILFSRKLIDQSFFKFAINQKLDELIDKAHGGSGLRHVTKGKFEDTKISLPPKNEQKRIANKVDALFARSDKAKNALDAISTLLDEYRQSILAAAFRGNLSDDWRKKNGVKINSWKTADLNSLGTWSGGGTPKKSQESYWEKGNVLWASPKDMKTDIIIDTKDKITNEAILKSSAKYIDANSILMVTRSGILQHTFPVAIAGKNLTVNQDLKALTVSQGIEFKFVFYALRAFEKDILRNCAKDGTTVQSIETDKLKSFSIPLPSQNEQHEIVRILDVKFDHIERILDQCNKASNKNSELKTAIMIKAFQGKLVPQDPNDEPANVLLKRIQIECEKLKKELKGKKKVSRKKINGKRKKMIIPVIDALKQSEKPLSAQQLLSAAGYPNNADTDQIEQFFLDIRKALNEMQIETWRKNDQDYFKIAG